jgi:hypothetical protein
LDVLFLCSPREKEPKRNISARPASRFFLLVPPALSEVEGSKVEGSEVEGSQVEGSVVEGRFSKPAGPSRLGPQKREPPESLKGSSARFCDVYPPLAGSARDDGKIHCSVFDRILLAIKSLQT